MTEPSDDELRKLADEAYKFRNMTDYRSAVVICNRALYRAGYAAGLRAALEACARVASHTISYESIGVRLCADAIAKLEKSDNT